MQDLVSRYGNDIDMRYLVQEHKSRLQECGAWEYINTKMSGTTKTDLVAAIEVPEIQSLLQTHLVQYTRVPNCVEARLVNQNDLQKSLITYVTDQYGNVVVKTQKHFKPQDAGILLRYRYPISGSVYNEWFVSAEGSVGAQYTIGV